MRRSTQHWSRWEGKFDAGGTVKDLLRDQEARATHAILAIGGFLGEKRVAVPLSSLTFKQ